MAFTGTGLLAFYVRFNSEVFSGPLALPPNQGEDELSILYLSIL